MAGEKREWNIKFNQDICYFSAIETIKANIEQDSVKVSFDEFAAGHSNDVRKTRNSVSNSCYNLANEMRYEMFMLNN